jgi:hypothetical protein
MQRTSHRDPHSWSRALLRAVAMGTLAVMALAPVVVGILVAGSVRDWPVDADTLRTGVGSGLVGCGLLALAVGVHWSSFMVRARRVAQRVPSMNVRYLLAPARAWHDDDCLIVFPLVGDVAPLGIVDLVLRCPADFPAMGTAWLAGPLGPGGAPVDGSLVVPCPASGPSWPLSRYRAATADRLEALRRP